MSKKFKLHCFDPINGTSFSDEIIISSKANFPAERTAAILRRVYEQELPSVEVLGIVRIEEAERGFY